MTLHDLKAKFNLSQTEDEQFFREWQDGLPELSEAELRALDRVKSNYGNLIESPPLLENAVKMVVLSPLLDLAGFYQPPFKIETETSIDLVTEDEGAIVKGRIDVLVIQEQFWVLVIESKKAEFSLEAARAQALAYMLANLHPDQPSLGMITNGGSFVFVKLVKLQMPQYALSRVFSILSPGNELYNVLSILKRIGTAIANGSIPLL
jgi:hypothetical protein